MCPGSSPGSCFKVNLIQKAGSTTSLSWEGFPFTALSTGTGRTKPVPTEWGDDSHRSVQESLFTTKNMAAVDAEQVSETVTVKASKSISLSAKNHQQSLTSAQEHCWLDHKLTLGVNKVTNTSTSLFCACWYRLLGVKVKPRGSRLRRRWSKTENPK